MAEHGSENAGGGTEISHKCIDLPALGVAKLLAGNIGIAQELGEAGWFFPCHPQLVNDLDFRIFCQSMLELLDTRMRHVPSVENQSWDHSGGSDTHIAISPITAPRPCVIVLMLKERRVNISSS